MNFLSNLNTFFQNWDSEKQGIIFSSVVILLLIYIIYLNYKIHKFTRGESGKSLESVIRECLVRVEEIEKRNELISGHALSLEERLRKAVKSVSIKRYKAYENGGSNQSFSVSFLDEEGNGAVISSLHLNENSRTFAKPINKHKSEYELTDEEKEVVGEFANKSKVKSL